MERLYRRYLYVSNLSVHWKNKTENNMHIIIVYWKQHTESLDVYSLLLCTELTWDKGKSTGTTDKKLGKSIHPHYHLRREKCFE